MSKYFEEEDTIRVSAGGSSNNNEADNSNNVVYPTISLAGRDPLDFGNVQKRKQDAESFLKMNRRGSEKSKSNEDSHNNLQDSTNSMEEPSTQEDEDRPAGFPEVITVQEDEDDEEDVAAWTRSNRTKN